MGFTLRWTVTSRSNNPPNGGRLNGTLTRTLRIRFRTANDFEMRNTLDGDVDRLVLSTDIGTFAVRILLVADGDKVPVAAAPPASIVPLIGHGVPLVRPRWVRVLRDEGLEFVIALFLDVDVVADVRLESATM